MLSGFLYLLSILLLHLSSQTTLAIPLNEFYPFGAETGDKTLSRTDDGSSPLIELVSSVFPFYGQEYDQLFVSQLSI